MKYLKHMSDSSSDDFIVQLEDKFGLEGYARWWKLLEVIAAQMKNSDDYTLAYPWSKWQAILKARRKKLKEFLTFCEEKEKIVLGISHEKPGRTLVETQQNLGGTLVETQLLQSFSGNELIISIPKLKEIKDNYTRDLAVTTKPLPSLKEEVKGKEDKPPRFSFSDADMETAVFILGKVQSIIPNTKEPNLESWANDIRLTREQDKRSHEEIKTLFSWANKNRFWRSNILCPGKLRDKWNQLQIQKSSNGNGYRSQADHNSSSTGRVVV
jgi:hypothetical protein